MAGEMEGRRQSDQLVNSLLTRMIQRQAQLNEDATALRYLLRLPSLAADPPTDMGRPDDLHGRVSRLRSAYPGTAPTALMPELEDTLGQAQSLLDARPSAHDVRDAQAATGWLHLLAATARFDLFDRPASRFYRRQAERLARESGDAELLGWAYETAAYFSFIEGHLREGIGYSRAAQQTAPRLSNAAVAGHLQEARCWSQLGSPVEAVAALHRARTIFERLPDAVPTGDHYAFDAAKFDFFIATTYAEAGRTAEAEKLARSVVATCEHRPNTAANGRVTLAITLMHRGEIDEAAHEAATALTGSMVHPDTLRRAREVGRFLAPHSALGCVQELLARLASLARREANKG